MTDKSRSKTRRQHVIIMAALLSTVAAFGQPQTRFPTVNDVGNAAGNAANQAGNAAGNAANAAGNAAAGAANAAGTVVSNTVNAAADAAGNAANAAGSAASDAANAAGNAAGNAANAAGTAAGNAANAAGTAAGNAAPGQPGNAAKATGKAVGNAASQTGNAAANTANAVGQAAGTAASSAGNAAAAGAKAAGGAAGTAAGNAASQTGNAAKTTGAAAGKAATTTGNAAGNAAKKTVETVGNTGKTAAENFGNAAKDALTFPHKIVVQYTEDYGDDPWSYGDPTSVVHWGGQANSTLTAKGLLFENSSLRAVPDHAIPIINRRLNNERRFEYRYDPSIGFAVSWIFFYREGIDPVTVNPVIQGATNAMAMIAGVFPPVAHSSPVKLTNPVTKQEVAVGCVAIAVKRTGEPLSDVNLVLQTAFGAYPMTLKPTYCPSPSRPTYGLGIPSATSSMARSNVLTLASGETLTIPVSRSLDCVRGEVSFPLVFTGNFTGPSELRFAAGQREAQLQIRALDARFLGAAGRSITNGAVAFYRPGTGNLETRLRGGPVVRYSKLRYNSIPAGMVSRIEPLATKPGGNAQSRTNRMSTP